MRPQNCDQFAAQNWTPKIVFVRGKASCLLDWEERPFFLKFNSEVRAEREAAFRERCEKVEFDGTLYLAAENAKPAPACKHRSPKYPELFVNLKPKSR